MDDDGSTYLDDEWPEVVGRDEEHGQQNERGTKLLEELGRWRGAEDIPANPRSPTRITPCDAGSPTHGSPGGCTYGGLDSLDDLAPLSLDLYLLCLVEVTLLHHQLHHHRHVGLAADLHAELLLVLLVHEPVEQTGTLQASHLFLHDLTT